MSLTRPTLTSLIDRIAADFKAAFGATYIALRSFLMVFSRVIGGAVHLLYGYIDNVVDELFVLTASTTYLERIGAEYGILRNEAVAAKGTVTITGVAGTIVPIGTELQSSSDNLYTTDAAATIGIGGSITADVTASEEGTASNESGGAVLTFVTPIAGVDTSVTADSDGLTGGTDEETDDDYRTRILDRKRFAPQGGCAEDYIAWAKEVSGVTRAWVYEQYQGRGTLAVFFMRDGDANPFPNAAALLAVYNYIVSHEDSRGVTVGCPVTAKPGLFVLAPTAKTVDMSIAIYPNTVAVQAQVTAELEDLFQREGGLGETIYLSEIREAISAAADEEHHTLVSPVADVACLYNEVAVLGTITWSAY